MGKDGAPDSVNNAQPAWMPRVGFAYQLNDKTVVRGGRGIFFDTNNVLNDGLQQTGYNRGTSTTITNDNGFTFLGANMTSAECLASQSIGRRMPKTTHFARSAAATGFA